MTHSETIRSALEQEILSGEMASGARIDEALLAKRFSVSRTPARAALMQLAAADLVTLVPRQGAIVSSITFRDYVALSEIVVQLEALATRLAARRMVDADREAFRVAMQACVAAADAQDPSAYSSANNRFHAVLYDASRNAHLARQIRTMRARMRGLQDFRFSQPARLTASLVEHRAIFDAVMRGDEEGASRAMAEHISAGGTVYADVIAKMPPEADVSARRTAR